MRTKRRYGWKRSYPDKRDFKYAVNEAVILPDSADLRSGFPPAYDQEQTSSCTGNGTSGAFEYDLIKEGKTDFTPSRLFAYFNGRLQEGDTDQDGGAQIKDVVKSVAKFGICTETTWPFDANQVTVKPSDEAYAEAAPWEIKNYSNIPDGNLQLIKQALSQGSPVIFGFTVFQSFEDQAPGSIAETGIMTMPGEDEQQIGGHCVVAVGYTDDKKWVICRNSWGPIWGDHGYFYMPYDFITTMAADFWVINSV